MSWILVCIVIMLLMWPYHRWTVGRDPARRRDALRVHRWFTCPLLALVCLALGCLSLAREGWGWEAAERLLLSAGFVLTMGWRRAWVPQESSAS